MSRAATAPAGPAPTLAGLHADFERAARGAGGAVDLRLRIAARPVCIRFAGQAAAKALRPAFAHLEAQETEPPALTLHVWDSERPAAAPPRSAEADAGAAGTGPSYYSESDGSRALHQPASDVFSVLTTEADRGWFWMPDATALPYWDYTAPFRHLLSWWLDAEGFRHVHGGAVGTAEGGVLLVGPGGSGKSTTALASLLDERLRYAGDDYVAVGSGPAPAVHSLYCSGKVHPEDLSRLPHLEALLADGNPADEKAVFYVESATAGFPLRAIVLPRVTDRRAARAIPGTQAAALAALAPSTIFQLHPPAREALAQMAQLVRRVPTYVLELGTDVETIPAELLRLLEQ
ncbi:MAG TPA: hypothetical protein VE596_19160 [Gaiellaceae bacterium]|nr:hypothetical protein [Gaiellaceae bacterium]